MLQYVFLVIYQQGRRSKSNNPNYTSCEVKANTRIIKRLTLYYFIWEVQYKTKFILQCSLKWWQKCSCNKLRQAFSNNIFFSTIFTILWKKHEILRLLVHGVASSSSNKCTTLQWHPYYQVIDDSWLNSLIPLGCQ